MTTTIQKKFIFRKSPRDGQSGCIMRTTEWAEGIEYHNDDGLPTWPRFIDQVVVSYPPTSRIPFDVFLCIKTHISSKNENYEDTRYWKKLNNMSPIYTPLIMAEYGWIRFSQTNQLLVMDADKVVAGMGGGAYPLWIGGDSPDAVETKYRVSKDGYVEADGGVFSGFIRHKPTVITPDNYREYIIPRGHGYVGGILNLTKSGTYIVFEDSPNRRWAESDSDLQSAMTVILPGYASGAEINDYYGNALEIVGNTVVFENHAVFKPEIDGFVPNVVVLSVFKDSQGRIKEDSRQIAPMRVAVCESQMSAAGFDDYFVYWNIAISKPQYTKQFSLFDE